jgi:transcriptional regulator with XRE-family HTH domain
MGEYLRARRALLDPEAAGFPVDRHRRVTGLRREEVAQLAGISPEYYLRLEQGRDHLPSAQVLNAIADALQLDDDARVYLERLARPRPRSAARSVPLREDLSLVRHLFAQWTHTAAFISDRNLDVIHANHLAEELGQGYLSAGSNPLLTLFAPGVRERHPDWEGNVARVVAALRMSSDPLDPRLQQIVGGLSMQSPDFRRIWARQDVAVLPGGTCTVHVAPFGPTELVCQNFAVAGHPGCTMTTIFAAPGSPGVSVLAYLASRAGTTGSVPAQPAPPSLTTA